MPSSHPHPRNHRHHRLHHPWASAPTSDPGERATDLHLRQRRIFISTPNPDERGDRSASPPSLRSISRRLAPARSPRTELPLSETLPTSGTDDFHEQHSSSKKYDVSFSFNRVCLKRAYHAVSAAKDPSLHNIIFLDARSSTSFLYASPCPPLSELKEFKQRSLK